MTFILLEDHTQSKGSKLPAISANGQCRQGVGVVGGWCTRGQAWQRVFSAGEGQLAGSGVCLINCVVSSGCTAQSSQFLPLQKWVL